MAKGRQGRPWTTPPDISIKGPNEQVCDSLARSGATVEAKDQGPKVTGIKGGVAVPRPENGRPSEADTARPWGRMASSPASFLGSGGGRRRTSLAHPLPPRSRVGGSPTLLKAGPGGSTWEL